MATNNKRREATRRQLEAQLRDRQQREARRKRAVLIGSIAGTVVIIAVVIVLIVVFGGGGPSTPKKNVAGGATRSASPSSSLSRSASPSPSSSTFPTDTPCKVTDPKGAVVFDGVTIANPTNLAKNPTVTSCSKVVPKTLVYKDLVVGKGTAPTSKSTVSVQYAGVFLQDGYAFDSSWKDTGKPVSFPLTQVVPGFTQAIAGTSKIPPMKIGGRRVVILPSALAYGPTGSNGIPANTPLVFVIDLTSVS